MQPRQRDTRFRNIGGFTLVELTLSMAIIAILAAIAMPRYSRAISSYRARAAAQRVANDIAQAQSAARTTSSTKTIIFDSTANLYRISGVANYDNSALSYTVYLADEPYKSTISSVKLTSGTQIAFDGFGLPDQSGTISISSGDTTRTVTIDAATGKVSVQ